MKVAFVHEYLNQYGGAEIVLRHMHDLYPDAPVYTLIYNPKKLPADINKWDIRPVGWSKYLPFKNKLFRNYALIYPTMVEQIDLREYDLVLSSSYIWARGVITPSRCLHITYCHTPTRQSWELYFDYKESYSRFIRKVIYPFAFNYLRMWDKLAADRVDEYIANSANVKQRIKKYYRRDSEIIYPPVESEKYTLSTSYHDYYICLSRLVPYKRIDLAVEAFNRLGKKLVVVGTGNEINHLKHIAKNNIEFTGFVSSSEKDKLLSKAKALIFPGEEDFGIVPVEAQLSGKPVIGFGKAGILETVEENKTGIHFNEQTVDSIIDAVERFEQKIDDFDPYAIRDFAMQFDKNIFIDKMKNFIDRKYSLWIENLP
ncbi:MAG: glycosyltransferase [Candidatus Zixiibacteriota bacterium]